MTLNQIPRNLQVHTQLKNAQNTVQVLSSNVCSYLAEEYSKGENKEEPLSPEADVSSKFSLKFNNCSYFVFNRGCQGWLHVTCNFIQANWFALLEYENTSFFFLGGCGFC